MLPRAIARHPDRPARSDRCTHAFGRANSRAAVPHLRVNDVAAIRRRQPEPRWPSVTRAGTITAGALKYEWPAEFTPLTVFNAPSTSWRRNACTAAAASLATALKRTACCSVPRTARSPPDHRESRDDSRTQPWLAATGIQSLVGAVGSALPVLIGEATHDTHELQV